MKPDALDAAILKYATGWDNAIAAKIVIGLVGLMFIVLTVRAILRKRTTVISALLWLVAGSVLLAFSFFAQEMVWFVMSTDYFTRLRVLLGVLSAVVLLITFESIRRTHLQERYALLWVISGVLVLVTVFYPNALGLLRAVTGMEYGTAVASVAFTFLLMVAFHFSIAMSAMETDQQRNVQRIAVLEARLKALEKKLSGDGQN